MIRSKIETDQAIMANEFNRFKMFMKNPKLISFFSSQTTPNEIEKIINPLNLNKLLYFS